MTKLNWSRPTRDRNKQYTNDMVGDIPIHRREEWNLYGKRIPIYYLKEELNFGKYKNRKIIDLLNSDNKDEYGYINFLIIKKIIALRGEK